MPVQRSHRLPTTVTPERYEIKLTPDLSACRFSGEETVFLKVHQPTNEIVLHAIEIAIESAAVEGPGGDALGAGISFDAANEQAVLVFDKTLAPGSWRLRLVFNGVLNDKLHGFYRSTYKDAAGRQKILAATQFESTDARRAFPCWDEPAFKAVFQVTLVIDEGLTAISNARVVRETPLPRSGKKEVVFADTIKMSSYLVAFIVGEFEATEPAHVGTTPLRVWAVPGKRRLARFAQNIGAFSLSFFSRYYDIPYPGDKLDLIAIPDFASGAMENLGAITFRETALLVDEERATRSELERVADVVSHENAHMWFGDLVTMRWWNGLWLNEAFATFMEMLAVDAWKPEWRRWESFTVSRAAALQVDGLKSTRPIEFPVERPEEAAGMFDVLTYEKGASVLRMLEQYLGADAFRDGIRLYLRRHEYGNAETTDLWDAIEDSSREPVRKLMDSWIFQPGYPLITVAKDGSGVRLSQRVFRYLADGQEPGQKWHVPIFLRAGKKSGTLNRTVLLSEAAERIDLGEPFDWVVVNAGGHGFYRVRYDDELMSALRSNLQQNLLPVERFNLVNDTWATTLAGLTPLTEYLDLLYLLRDETNLNVWTAVLASCHHLNRIFDDPQRRRFRQCVRDILKPAFARLGWAPKAGESELESQLRGDLASALGTVAEDEELQEHAKELYRRFAADADAVDRNLVPALVTIVAYTGAESEYDNFCSNFKSARTPQEEQRYLFALASFRKPSLIRRTLELTIGGEVRTQNAPYLMRALLLNIDGREIAWSFMKEHWEEMIKKYPDNSIPRMCEGIIGLVTPELEADVRSFFAGHPVKQGTRQIEQHLERLRIAVACKERWKELLRE
ncbi:MAG TPA: M1 family metallopeptidase [Candidatus Acidoferrales bacterium]|nr:M1 family metallopeptidase [Candidatus Acidoferrales bacterium]